MPANFAGLEKNAIMMIDFAVEAERDVGMTPEQSIRRAALLRFRPIMMTTMAALLGALPLALGVGAGAELRQPLGITIVGGLLLSQVLTLYTTPVIYLYLDRLHRRLGRRPARATSASQPEPVVSGDALVGFRGGEVGTGSRGKGGLVRGRERR